MGFFEKTLHGMVFHNIGLCLMVFGGVMIGVDYIGGTALKMEKMTFSQSFVIGVVQVLSVVPGVSRMGACMIILRLLGFNRLDTLRFSIFLGACTSLCAGTYFLYTEPRLLDFVCSRDYLMLGALVFFFSFMTLCGVSFLIKKHDTFVPIFLYRIALGFMIYRFY